MCCHHSHCPQTSKKHCCYSTACLHKLNNRLWRRHETLDSLETELATVQSAIASLTRRLERECHHDYCRQDCTTMRTARKLYENQMGCECARSSSSGYSRCSCRECAIGNKDVEISLLRRKIRAAEDFEDVLQGLEERRQCRRQQQLLASSNFPVRVVQERRVRVVADVMNGSYGVDALNIALVQGLGGVPAYGHTLLGGHGSGWR